MAPKYYVIHRSRIIRLRTHTVTGTLCNRMSDAADDFNVATTDDDVTCKFCLREMRSKPRAA